MKRPRPEPRAQPAAEERRAPGVRIGRVVAATAGRARVDFDGCGGAPVAARTMVPLAPAALADAVARRREVVLLFEEDDPGRPIIAGFLEAPAPAGALAAVLDATLETALDATLAARPDVAEVDGRRVVIEGQDEIVLRCGDASITLRRNGKVVIHGLYVETHAAGTNRIKGGSVKIN